MSKKPFDEVLEQFVMAWGANAPEIRQSFANIEAINTEIEAKNKQLSALKAEQAADNIEGGIRQ